MTVRTSLICDWTLIGIHPIRRNVAIVIDQATMDALVGQRTKAQQALNKAKNDVLADQAQVTTQQSQLDSFTALINGSVVGP